jgi:hypothetical protein
VVALARTLPAHDVVDVGTPFYAPMARPGEQPGPPVLHKFDRVDFVKRYFAEVGAAGAAPPGSLLGSIAPPPVLDVDTDALDYMGRRFRKLYQPAHFRFYLAACELRCLVPGFPAPTQTKIRKVEFVIRRVALRRDPPVRPARPPKPTKPPKPAKPPAAKLPTKPGCEGAAPPAPAPIEIVPECLRPEPPPPPPVLVPVPAAPLPPTVVTVGGSDGPVIDAREWAWVEVPDPSLFPAPPPPAALELAARLTGNTHTWWPIPRSEPALEGEERFPMSKVPGLDGKAVYFGYIPTASGEMYGPRQVPLDDGGVPIPQPADPGAPSLTASQVVSAAPLVPASTSYALKPATIRSWRTSDWRGLLGLFNHGTTTGPRPKFEAPDLDGEPTAGWAYVIRCVATLEPEPGCVVEQWGPASEPVVMAPFYDPFGGRPTQIDLPSLNTIKKMLGGLAGAQLAARGGLPLGVGHKDCYPTMKSKGSDGNFYDPSQVPDGVTLSSDLTDMKLDDAPDCPSNPSLPLQLCFWPIFILTILAYLMINIGLVILIVFNFSFAILIKLKFCIGLGGNAQ